jgi:hypothetical protein
MLTKLRDDAPWRIFQEAADGLVLTPFHRDLGYDQFANSSKLRSQRIQNQGAVQKRERAMAMFEGVDRNRNIMIVAAVVVVILVIIYLYTAGHLSGIV